MEMKNVNWKELFIDILVDIVAGMIIAVGIYNFALNADFPVAGFSGICDHSVSHIRIAGRCRNHYSERTCCNLLL